MQEPQIYKVIPRSNLGHRADYNLCTRLKPEMWSQVAGEMKIPWRAAEAMHWQLGEEDIARRAGTVPFSISSSAALEGPAKGKREGASGRATSGAGSSTKGGDAKGKDS